MGPTVREFAWADPARPWPQSGDPPLVFTAALTPGRIAHAEATAALTPAERARADRYRNDRARSQFVAVRTMLRVLLGERLGVPPTAVPLTTTADGKPALAGGPAGFAFNVSHTDGLALLAFAPTLVGVDVEPRKPMPSAADLVGRFFAPAERRQFRALPDDLRLPGFFKAWVCKEAILKGVGCGARGLGGCVVDLDPRTPARVVELTGPAADAGPEWDLHVWEPAPGYTAAVAAKLGCNDS